MTAYKFIITGWPGKAPSKLYYILQEPSILGHPNFERPLLIKEELLKMKQTADLIQALNQVAKEKGIDKDVIFDAIEMSLITACKKNFGKSDNIKVVIDRKTGSVNVYAQKRVVEKVTDDTMEITLEAAKKLNDKARLDDCVDIIIMPKNFGRISAQTAKQMVLQKFREAEREILYNEYIAKERDVVTGIVQRKEHRDVYIALGRIEAVLPAKEQVDGEMYEFQDRVKVYVTEVRQGAKGPVIHVSRTHPELVKRLFEQEVPEVRNGIVEIKSISREPGLRTKIAVYSNNKDVDPVGACVGQNGHRVNIIVTELRGEKIDILAWHEDPRRFIASALNPCRILAVALDTGTRTARVVVPEGQLSLAIGKDGQNVRLAAWLTGWRIDLKNESEARETDFVSHQDYLFMNQENIVKQFSGYSKFFTHNPDMENDEDDEYDGLGYEYPDEDTYEEYDESYVDN
jgi:N utilization substance protein A